MIKFKDFTFFYSDEENPALVDINLQVSDGEFLLLTGPSGSGKSSLCRCLNGLIPHFYGGRVKGYVEVQGLNTLKHSTREIAEKVGMVFQDPENQLVTTDVEREIAFGLENLNLPSEAIAKRVEEALDAVGISHLRNRPLQDLSGGEKQKVALASVLALHPEVLVLDEPTSQLDPKSAEELLSVVSRMNDELGITVILVEHRLDRVIHQVDRLLVMSEGKIVMDGSPKEILSNDCLERLGVGVPPIVKLTRRLRGRGFKVANVPLTVKDARAVLDDVFRSVSTTALPDDGVDRGELVIEAKNLRYVYPNGVEALRGIDLKIYCGEFIAVTGRNGSGKTTLLKMLNGLLKPTSGRITVCGLDTKTATVAELARRVGYVFQNPSDHLIGETVEEDLRISLESMNLQADYVDKEINHTLSKFNLSTHRHGYPPYLSGGERQRVALASVIIRRPKVLALDEPTRGMDFKLKTELMNLLKDYRREGNTVILVTHDIETIAEYCDRVILLSDGRVVADGPKRDVLSEALLFSPQINRLVKAYEKYGIPKGILTVDDVMKVLG
ncbi:MAG: energy-coupling factor transporter ATPase [Candidatus Bathyarchaeia archaeon]